METTQLTDRVDVLENQSKDGTGETNGNGGVTIEFNGKQPNKHPRINILRGPRDKLLSGLSDILQSQRYGPSYRPSNYNQHSPDQEINKKLIEEGFSMEKGSKIFHSHFIK